MENKKKPTVYIAMPCYDSMRVETCVSLLDTYSVLGKAGVTCKFKSFRSSLVTHARNLSTCGFLDSGCDYMLFVDADVEFSHEAVLRMLVPEKDIVCTPYRVKNKPGVMDYAVSYPDPGNVKILPWDLIELNEGPAGLMLIHRRVFESLMIKFPKLKCKFPEKNIKLINEEIGAVNEGASKYMWNFWDTSFKDQIWKGEDLAFCNLATEAGFKIYANLDSWTTHHGSWGWKRRFGDSLVKKRVE